MISKKFLSNKIKFLFHSCVFMCNISTNYYILILFTYFALTRVTLSMKKIKLSSIGASFDDFNLCLVDSTTMHIILKDLKYFSYLFLNESPNRSFFKNDEVPKIKENEEVFINYVVTRNYGNEMR